jgi:hypothetical protein
VLFARSDVFNMASRIPEIQLWIAFASAYTQQGIKCNAETKQLYPKRLTQWSSKYHYFLDSGREKVPAFFYLIPHIIDEVYIRHTISSTLARSDSHS